MYVCIYIYIYNMYRDISNRWTAGARGRSDRRAARPAQTPPALHAAEDGRAAGALLLVSILLLFV